MRKEVTPADAVSSLGSSGWDVYEIARSADPHPAWARLRETRPVLDAGGGVFFVTRWELVDRVLRDPALRAGIGVAESFGLREGRLHDLTESWLMSLDGPPHVRARGLVRREFTPRRLETLQPFIEKTARDLSRHLLERAEKDEVDLVREFAFAVPSEVIRHLFRIDRDAWAERVAPLFTLSEASQAPPTAMLEGVASFFDSDAGRAGGNQPDGLLEHLRRSDPEHGRLSELEVVANALLLVTAAIDTTTGLIANTAVCLLQRPKVLARVRTEPGLVAAAVEETLRFESPALSCSRFAPEPLELGGVAIPAGSHLLLGLAAANRDPRRYTDPDAFDLERDHAGIVSFGGGAHFCLGASLARLEARIALTHLLARDAPALEIAGPVQWRTDNPTVRAPRALPVRGS